MTTQFMTAHTAADSLASTYELWCESQGVHPEAPMAWEAYAQLLEDLASPDTRSRVAPRDAG